MKVYTVYIDSYVTDDSCATYDYSEDYLTFEEAQEVLEKKLWELETGEDMSGYENFFTERDTRYNRDKHCFEEYEGARYIYNIEITDKSFQISTPWRDFSGEIVENEIEETPFSLPVGHWRYVDEHGLPKENGIYLVSCTAEEWEVEKGIRSSRFTEYACFDAEDKCFHNNNGYNYNVYAWTETIEPA